MADSHATPGYHWTPTARMRFVETLALTGSVARAAAAAGKSRGQAYKLRRRAGETDFAAAWDAALLVAQQHIGDAVFRYAHEPLEYRLVPNADNTRRYWRRTDPLLGAGRGLGLVSRLDRAAARVCTDSARRTGAARLLPAMWDRLLDRIDP